MTKHPNTEVKMPDEYVEMMRYYIPRIALAAIKCAWKHNATPLEVIRHLERVEKQNDK